jgi:hypothetical protein
VVLNLGSYEYFNYIEYEVGGSIYKTTSTNNHSWPNTFFNIIDENNNVKEIRYDRHNNPSLIQTETQDLRHYGCVYSKARSDYKTKKITSTTTSELDKNKHDIDDTEDFTPLKQLIVDIVNQDYSAYAEVNRTLEIILKLGRNFTKHQSYLDLKMHSIIFLKNWSMKG